MPRTVINAQPFLGAYPNLPLSAGAAKTNWTAVDGPPDLSVALVDGKTIVELWNSHATLARTVSITGSPDAQNRSDGIVAYSVPAGEIHMLGPFKNLGWQIGGFLEINISDPTLRVSVRNTP